MKPSAAAVPAALISSPANLDCDMAPQPQLAPSGSMSSAVQADASKVAQKGHLQPAKPLTPSGAAVTDTQPDPQPSPAGGATAEHSPAAGSKALEQLGRLLRSGSATPLSCLKGQAVADVAGGLGTWQQFQLLCSSCNLAFLILSAVWLTSLVWFAGARAASPHQDDDLPPSKLARTEVQPPLKAAPALVQAKLDGVLGLCRPGMHAEVRSRSCLGFTCMV